MPLKIKNTTPWDTEALTKLLTFLCATTTIESVKVETLRTRPGVKREDQTLFLVSGVSHYNVTSPSPTPIKLPTEIVVGLISPKRAAIRTDLLDRMAQVNDLGPHEIALPNGIIGGICHAFGKIKALCGLNAPRIKQNSWDYRQHFNGSCKCGKHLSAYPVIRGDTKARTAPLVDIKKLKQRGRWALESAERHRVKMEEKLAEAAKLGERIRRFEAKAWEAKGNGKR